MRIEASPIEPIYAGQRPESSHRAESHRYVPGAVVLGAFAARWIREFGPPQQATAEGQADFLTLFHGDVVWPALWSTTSTVLPQSTKICKYGSRSRLDENCVTFASDLTAEHAIAATPVDRCPHCGGPLDNGKGQILDVAMTSATRVQLERMQGDDPDAVGRRERAKDGRLFTRRSIDRNTLLVGSSPSTAPWLADLAAEENLTIWFGGKRTVGGRSAVKLTPDQRQDPAPAPRRDGQVVLTARTPAVFVDDAGRPLLEPNLAELEADIGCSFEIERQWARPTMVGGWHAQTGLPKPEEVGVLQGSTWILKPAETLGSNELAKLAYLGLRIYEGLGHFDVNPEPFTFARDSEGQEESCVADTKADELHHTADELMELFDDDGLVDWVIDLLRQRAVEVAGGRQGSLAELRSRANYVRLRDRQSACLSRVVEEDSADSLIDLTAILSAHPGGGTQ